MTLKTLVEGLEDTLRALFTVIKTVTSVEVQSIHDCIIHQVIRTKLQSLNQHQPFLVWRETFPKWEILIQRRSEDVCSVDGLKKMINFSIKEICSIVIT